ncbi:hypothetical protein HBI18_192470 [Parastagonospora nodorum]|nr:hypothetical protein HBH77_081140 [Parastagonospora nodorum]KAH5520578.1 hypothetical protein HBI29_064700 [Parastagonospora nodorum]KAH5714715.1 hypothetical protein HBI18_192470 [Parastagonospora nodorum]KAH6035256.1 hypothetical protein HBI54_198090 [Parastagonospora nodorum]
MPECGVNQKKTRKNVSATTPPPHDNKSIFKNDSQPQQPPQILHPLHPHPPTNSSTQELNKRQQQEHHNKRTKQSGKKKREKASTLQANPYFDSTSPNPPSLLPPQTTKIK